MEFDGRTALVTGGSRGIGRAIALRLGAMGASVVINYAHDEAAAEEVRALLPGDGMIVKADVTRADQVKAMFAQVRERFKGVDILVNNAGILRDAYLAFLKEEDWDDVVDTAMKGTYLCMKAAVRAMISRKWGRIVNIGSDAGLMGDMQRVHYAGAKAGITGMTKAAARELAGHGITVNCIAPGLIDTGLAAGADAKKNEGILAMVPLGRIGTPQDVAGAAAFLVSEQAAYITGQVLRVDGGLYTG